MDVVATATGFRRMFDSHKLVPQNKNKKFYTRKCHPAGENVGAKDPYRLWSASHSSRDGFPGGLGRERDFPEAYLDVQKLSEEAP